jgi:Ran GTPase-activating protein (RanGAP) involved in mRNA processing and transport
MLGGEALMHAVIQSKLQELVLDKNNLASFSSKALSRMISKSRSLLRLSMVECHLGQNGG